VTLTGSLDGWAVVARPLPGFTGITGHPASAHGVAMETKNERSAVSSRVSKSMSMSKLMSVCGSAGFSGTVVLISGRIPGASKTPCSGTKKKRC
jgi:hypothetical protein